MTDETKEIIKDWQNRLQFTIVVLMFFLTFLSYLYPEDKIEDLNKVGLGMGMPIALFIVVYILIEVIKTKKMNVYKKVGNYVNILLLLEIASFIPMLLIKSAEKLTNPSYISFYKKLVEYCLASQFLIIPSITIFLVMVVIYNYIFLDFKKSELDLKNNKISIFLRKFSKK